MIVTLRCGIALWLLALSQLAASSAWAAASGDGEITSLRLGFGDRCKIGPWVPAWITVKGGSQPKRLRVELLAPDGDGVPVKFGMSADRLVPAGEEIVEETFVKIGRPKFELTARLLDGEKVVAERTFHDAELPASISSRHQWLVSVGEDLGVDSAITERLRGQAEPLVHARMEVEQLPSHWLGYEGVDRVIITTSDRAESRLSQRQFDALRDWLRRGGRLLLCVGSRGEELARDARWSLLLPSRDLEVVRQRQAPDLESTLGATKLGSFDLVVFREPRGIMQLGVETRGRGRQPLVTQAPLGTGEVTVVGVDLNQAPFAEWPGRAELVARLFREKSPRGESSAQSGGSGRVTHVGYDDLAGQLRGALDRFTGVRAMPFSWVAGLIAAYVLLIGPGDYFLLKRIGRMHWSWVTFPLTAVAFSALAVWMSGQLKGRSMAVNQLDIVDIDLDGGFVRGTTWAHLYSPRARLLDVDLESTPAISASPQDMLVSWQGLPGAGIGGLSASRTVAGFNASYGIERTDLGDGVTTRLAQLPVPEGSTRSIVARWTARADLQTPAPLELDAYRQLTGEFRNPLSSELHEAAVYYENWAFPVNRVLKPGEAVRLADLTARNLEWRLQRRSVRSLTEVTIPWNEDDVEDVPRILDMLMFHSAAGGRSYTRLSHRFQPYIDLSDQVRAGAAVLVGRADDPAAKVQVGTPHNANSSGNSESPPLDRRWTYYRILLPVHRAAEFASETR